MSDPLSYSDEQLVAQARGSLESFGLLYDRHYVGVLNACKRRVTEYTKNSDVDMDADAIAQDILQDTFIKAMNGVASCRGNFGGWIRKIADNECTDYFRRRANQELHFIDPETISPVPVVDDPEEGDDESLDQFTGVLDELMPILTPFQRKVIAGRRDGLSNQQIAKNLNSTPDSVKTNFSKAVKILKERAARRGGTGFNVRGSST